MASKTSIANEALLKIGEPRIASIDDTTDINAVFLSTIWDTTVKQVMAEVPWKCLTKRATLTASTAPVFTWGYSYPVPTGFLRPLWFNGHSFPDNEYFDVEGSSIVSNANTAQLVYTAFSDDVTTYAPSLIEAITLYLASKIAVVRRQDAPLANALAQEYKTIVTNRNSSPNIVETKSMWLEIGTDSEIMNSALTKIAEPKAVDFNDPSFVPLTTVQELYVSCIKQVMRSFDWKCLCKRATLTAGTAPEFGWDYSYPLPADCLRVVEFNGKPSLLCETFYRKEGTNILTNADTAELVYVAYDADETLYDEMFKEVVATLFASKLAVQRRRDANVAAALFQDHERAMSKARLTDSSQMHEARVDPRLQSHSYFARRMW